MNRTERFIALTHCCVSGRFAYLAGDTKFVGDFQRRTRGG
jgi:hypothetical protein